MFWYRLFLLILVSLIPSMASIKLGIFPYTDPIQIIKMHQPLKEFLEKKLGTKIEIYSGNGFEDFYKNTQKGLFDIVITPPHLGTLHIQNGFVPILRYNVYLTPFFVVRNDSPITKIDDIQNKKVALSNYLSISSLSGLVDLKTNNINLEKKNIINTKTHQAAVLSVIFGESDVAITTLTALKQMANNVDTTKTKSFKGTIKIPHVFTLAKPKTPANQIEKIQNFLKEFEQTKEGQAFLTSTGFMGYTEISDEDLKKMGPFLKETKLLLESKK